MIYFDFNAESTLFFVDNPITTSSFSTIEASSQCKLILNVINTLINKKSHAYANRPKHIMCF